jgi:hypothetical protein
MWAGRRIDEGGFNKVAVRLAGDQWSRTIAKLISSVLSSLRPHSPSSRSVSHSDNQILYLVLDDLCLSVVRYDATGRERRRCGLHHAVSSHVDWVQRRHGFFQHTLFVLFW